MKSVSPKQTLTITTGIFVLGCSLYFIIHAAHFFKLTSEDLGKYFSIRWVLLAHIFFGAIALLSGPFQLWEYFRKKNWVLHRRLGKLYVLSIFISGSCAIFLSVTTAFAVSGAYAFSLHVWLGVWLTSTFYAYRTARQKKFKLHKEWMTRSYLVTLAFVISALLLKIPLIQRLGSFEEVSPSLFWLSWAVPLYIYDLRLSIARKQ
jgi:uncharacterized membrane protein